MTRELIWKVDKFFFLYILIPINIIKILEIIELAKKHIKLSTKARYGMRAMVDLALHYGEGPVLLKNIAKRQEVSMKYLDEIISAIKANFLSTAQTAKDIKKL